MKMIYFIQISFPYRNHDRIVSFHQLSCNTFECSLVLFLTSGLARKIVQVYITCIILWKNLNELFGQPKVYSYIMGFPGGSVVKNPPASAGDAGDTGSIPGLRRSPGGGNGNPAGILA